MKKIVKEYGTSIVLSFLTGFLIVMVQEPSVWNVQSIKDGSFVGVMLVGVRTGIKAIVDILIYIKSTMK